MKAGSGAITINKRAIDEYYLRPTSKMIVMQPLELTNTVGQYDLNVNVTGGGLSGQAGAIAHAVSKRRWLSSAQSIVKFLKKAGLITRDSRKKEESFLVSLEQERNSNSQSVNPWNASANPSDFGRGLFFLPGF